MLLPLTLLALAVLIPAPVALAADAPNSLGLSATYDVTANIRWDAGRMSVTSIATVTNSTDNPVDALTFNFVPALIGHMNLREVRVDDEGTTAQVDDANVVVSLPVPLDPGSQATVLIGYDATFNTTGTKKKWLQCQPALQDRDDRSQWRHSQCPHAGPVLDQSDQSHPDCV